MSGTWATARAAIAGHFDGLEIDEPTAETMVGLEYPPDGVQDSVPAYAYVVPPARVVTPAAGDQVVTEFDEVKVRVLIAPRSNDGGNTQLGERLESWIAAIVTEFKDAIALGGTADLWTQLLFGEPGQLDTTGQWGFDVSFVGLRISETRTLSA